VSKRLPGSRRAGPRPELELLLCCARVSLTPERVDRIRTLVHQDLDWESLLHSARVHGVASLLYWHLNATCPQAVPPASLGSLRDCFAWNLGHNLFLTDELVQLLDLLTAQGIRAMPFKGPAVAAALYGTVAFREFCDLDILVQPKDFLRAQDVLLARGYQGYWPHIQMNQTRRAAFVQRHVHALGFSHAQSQILVEIHWKLMPSWFCFPLRPECLWERRAPVWLSGKSVPTLSPEDALLVACVHGCKHVWARLGWICDVAEWLRLHQGTDWERLFEQARRLGSQRMLLLGLSVARDLLGTPLPEPVDHRAGADGGVRTLTRQVRRQFFQESASESGLWATGIFHLRARDGLRDRIRYSLRGALIPSPADWEFLPLPAPLHFLYPVLRPLRLLNGYASALHPVRAPKVAAGASPPSKP
jgi:hypothetical protein